MISIVRKRAVLESLADQAPAIMITGQKIDEQVMKQYYHDLIDRLTEKALSELRYEAANEDRDTGS